MNSILALISSRDDNGTARLVWSKTRAQMPFEHTITIMTFVLTSDAVVDDNWLMFLFRLLNKPLDDVVQQKRILYPALITNPHSNNVGLRGNADDHRIARGAVAVPSGNGSNGCAMPVII